ncbi:MAG: hypothetical protein PHD95_00580 [Candidatus ainarchaeum sp.]|nr:hypothetical protein [Candidatus ainarchaeum sp.]
MNRLKKFSRRKPPEKRQKVRLLTSSDTQGSDFFLQSEHFIITGEGKTVSSPRRYRNFFGKGETILNAHFDTTTEKLPSPREALLLLRRFVGTFSELKRAGYSSFVGDTPNSALVNFFRRQGAQITQTPLPTGMGAKLRYARSVYDWNYPRQYAKMPVFRVMLRF